MINQLNSRLTEKGIEFTRHYRILKNCSILKKEYDLGPLIEEVYQKLKKGYDIEKIKTAEPVQKYRNFSWHFLKLDPTKNRPSGEALARRLINSKKIPKINPFVDAYNLASAETFLSLSAYDISKIKIPISIQFAAQGMKFFGIGGIEITLDGNELILVDAENQIITQYLYRDSENTKVTENSREILLIANSVNHISDNDANFALERTELYLNWMKDNQIIEFSS